MACLIINPYTGKEEESKLSIKLIEAYGVEQGESYYNNFVLPFIRKTEDPTETISEGQYSLFSFAKNIPAEELYHPTQLEPTFKVIKTYINMLKQAQVDSRNLILPNVQTPTILLDSYETSVLMEGFSVNFFEKLFSEGLGTFSITKPVVVKHAKEAFTEVKEEIKTQIVKLRAETDAIEAKYGEAHPKTVAAFNKEERLTDIAVAIKTSPLHMYDYFLNVHLRELGIELELTETEDEVGEAEEAIDTNIQQTGDDKAFNFNAFSTDPKTNTPKSIKRIMYGLPLLDKKGQQLFNDEMGTKRMKAYDQVFAKLADELSNISPNPAEFVRHVENLKDPVLNHLVERLRAKEIDYSQLKYSKDPKAFERSLLKFNLLSAFTQQFSKHKYDFQSLIMDISEGSMYFANNNQERLTTIIRMEWSNNFTDKLTRNYFNKQDLYKSAALAADLKKAFDNNRIGRFLELLGVKLSDANVMKANFIDKGGKHTTLKQIVADINTTFVKEGIYGANHTNLFDLFSGNSPAPIAIRKLVDLETRSTESIRNLGHLNEENNLLYDINLNTFLTILANDLNEHAGNEAKLAEKYPLLFGPNTSEFVKNSAWRKAVLNGATIDVGVLGGANIPDNIVAGKTTKDLSGPDLYIQKMIGAFDGKFAFLRAADRGIENYFSITGQQATSAVVIRERLKGYLKDELNAIYQLVENGVGADVVHYKDNGIFFRVFSELNKEKPEYQLAFLREQVFPLIESGALEDESIGDYKIDGVKIQDIVENNMRAVQQAEVDLAVELGFLKENNGKISKGVLKIPDKITNLPMIKEKAATPSSRAVVAIKLAGLNNYVANIEQSKLFVGDPAQFKNEGDFFKRMSMMNSTKEISLVDARTNEFLVNSEFLLEEKNGFKYADDPTLIEGGIRTMTVADEEDQVSAETRAFVEKVFNDTLKEELKGQKNAVAKIKKKVEAYMKVYDEMEVADAMAYITLDEFKRLKIRAGQWLPEHERSYNRIVNNDGVTPKDIKAFSVQKYQYTGTVNSKKGSIHLIGGRKFSFMPLIPQVLPKGSNLEKLNKQMLATGTGMAFMGTAAKFGHNADTHDFYNEDGEFNIDLKAKPVFDILDYKYMGDQLKINDKEKEQISQSTQFRKLIFVNFYQNGQITAKDEVLKGDLERLGELQSELIQQTYADLSEELGFDIKSEGKLPLNYANPHLDKDTGVLTVDYKDANGTYALALHEDDGNVLDEVDFDSENSGVFTGKTRQSPLTDEMARDIVTNYKEAGGIRGVNDENIKLIVDGIKARFFDKGLSANMINALSKVTDLGLIDTVPGKQKIEHTIMSIFRKNIMNNKRAGESMAQVSSMGFEVGTKADALKWYEEDKDGNLLPMQVMIPLPKKLIEYVVRKYGSGTTFTQAALDSFNKDVIDDENKFRETGVMTELTKIRRLTGFRIPFQAPSSGDVAHVAKYLNPQFATGVVVPKEMVAKTGSDFDIDKFNMYYNLYKVNKDDNKDWKLELDDAPLSKIYNELNEVEQRITLHKENARQLLAPLTTVLLDEITKYIRETRGDEKQTKSKKAINELFRTDTQLDKANAFLSGKNGVGQVAVHVTNHPITQQADLHINIGYNMRFDEVEDGTVPSTIVNREDPVTGQRVSLKYLSLGNALDSQGNLISETLSELLTAYVDIAKDAYIFDINAIAEVANSMLLMLRTGVDPLNVFKFINQPIIKDYFKTKQIGNSFISRMSRGSLFPVSQPRIEQRVKERVLKQVQGSATVSELAKEYTDDASIAKNLPDHKLVKGLQGKITSKEDAFFQLTALNKFLTINDKAKRMQAVIRATSADTKYFKDYEQANHQLSEVENVKRVNGNDQLFQNLEEMFTVNPIVAETTKDKFDFIKVFMNSLSIAYNPNFITELKDLKELSTESIFEMEKAQRVRQEVDYAFVSYLYSTELNGENQIEYRRIFDELIAPENMEDSLAYKLKNYKGRLREYILPMLAKPQLGIKENKVKLKVREITTDVSNILSSELLQIRNTDPQLYDDIFRVALVQSPMRLGAFNLLQFIDNDEYAATVRQVLEKVKTKKGGLAVAMNDFRQQFFLANPELVWDTFGNWRTEIEINNLELGISKKTKIKGRGLKIGVQALKLTDVEKGTVKKPTLTQTDKPIEQLARQAEALFGNLGIIGVLRDSLTGKYYFVDGVTNKLVEANGNGNHYKLYGTVKEVRESEINLKVINTFKQKVKKEELNC